MRGTPSERFWAKVTVDASGCWVWTAYCNDKGYGVFWDGVRLVLSHGWAYEHFFGAVPEGMDVDHVRARGCSHRNCVNPAHLEAVTHQENCARGDVGKASGALNTAKTHCPRGHEYSGANLYVKITGSRMCRTCSAAMSAKAHQRKKTHASASN